MTEQIVATVRTTLGMRDFAVALLGVWPEATKAAAGILWAHFAGETGDGVHCYGWNLGNVKWSKGCGLDYQALHGVTEYVGGHYVEIPTTDPGSWFRVYPSLADGMRAFVDSKRTGQWRSTWPYVEAANADAYARELRRLRYYTAPAEDYVAIMNAKHAAWMASKAFEDACVELWPDATEVVRTEAEPAIVHTLDLPGQPGFVPPETETGGDA